ncbi:MAG: hypothetical protein AB1611_02585 [bacterium]
MRKGIRTIMAAIVLVLCISNYSRAESWSKVVDKGFGNPANDYAWSMTVFQGKLYVGTLNGLTGAEIWRSSSGQPDSWERVYKSPADQSWGIRYLYADGDNALYACAFNVLGAMILRTENGKRWITVARAGLGNRENFTVRCMTRFGDYLYAGTGSDTAQLFRSRDGFNWRLVRTNPDFGSTKVREMSGRLITNNVLIGELAVFNDQLYAFTWTADLNIQSLRGLKNMETYSEESQDMEMEMFGLIGPTPGAFEIFRSSDGENWEKVVGENDPYGNGMGFSQHDRENLLNDAVTSTAVFKGHLYLGTESANSNSSVWRTADGAHWEKVVDFFSLGEKNNTYVWRMIPFKNRLFIGTFNVGPKTLPKVTGAQIWASDSGNAGTFYNLVHDGFDGEIIPASIIHIPKNFGIRSFCVFRGNLYAGTATVLSFAAPDPKLLGALSIMGNDVGCEVWELQ